MDAKLNQTTSSPKRVVVLGGGLAGLSAACHLLDKGYNVTLIEKRPFLGGRAFSFIDKETGVEIDNGQHVFMGCCTYFIDFLHMVDAYHKTFLQERLDVKVICRGKVGALYSVPRLGPLHLLPSLLTYPHIGLKDKLLAVFALLKMKSIDRETNRDTLDGETFYHWLKRHRQSEQSIAALWNLVILPTLNDDIKDVSAYMGLMIIQEGLLTGPKEAALGYARVGLTSLSGDSAQEYIASHGGELVLGKAVTSINMNGDKVEDVTLVGGERILGDVFISALPFHSLPELLPSHVAQIAAFSMGNGLTASPIVGIHIWYDRPVVDQDVIAFLDSPVQWVFNKTLIQRLDPLEGQYLCISISGAWEYADMSKEELRELFAREMETLFPKAKDATIKRFLTVKQLQATFRSMPGAYSHRPTQKTPVSNLFLAGDWTDTGWPSTMEGAVRSGVFAARAVAAEE